MTEPQMKKVNMARFRAWVILTMGPPERTSKHELQYI
jgi:hypothetical protein